MSKKKLDANDWWTIDSDFFDVESEYFSTVRVEKERWVGHTIIGDKTGGGHFDLLTRLDDVVRTIQDPLAIFKSKKQRHPNHRVLFGEKSKNGSLVCPPYIKVVVEENANTKGAIFVTAHISSRMDGVKDVPLYIRPKGKLR